MQLKPLNDRIVVTPVEAETKTAGGVILPDNVKEKPNQGRVVAVGPGKRLDSGEHSVPQLAIGDIVYYGKYAGTEVKVDGKEFKILREDDVLCVEG